MSSLHRELFTVDLHGWRAGLRKRAERSGLTEAAVLRSVLAAALASEQSDPSPVSPARGDATSATPVKLSVRVSKLASCRLDQNARAAGLSRGLYLTRLIDGAAPVAASSDRAAMFKALNASSAELAVLSRDLNHLTRLLRVGAVEAARMYAARHDALDADVRRHLALAASVLAELSSMCRTVQHGLADRRGDNPP